MNTVVPNVPRITITGSSGKTTTREMLASILQTKWRILKTSGNKNLPLHTKQTMQKLRANHQAVLLELGMGKPGAAHRHCRFIKPDIAVITNIGTAHFGNLGNSIRATAKNKSALIQYMNKNGILLINNDDHNSKWLETDIHTGKILTIGVNRSADYRASMIQYRNEGMSFSVTIDGAAESFFIPSYGYHNVYNALFAIAIAHQLRFSVHDIRRGLARYTPPVKRLNVTNLNEGSLLIDDTVNANPQSVKSAVDVLVRIGESKRKVAVIGSMLELGDYTNEAHLEIGRYMAQNGVDAIYTLGKETEWVRQGALKAGLAAHQVHYFTNRQRMHAALQRENLANSVILVKGSRSMKMDITSTFIRTRFTCSIQFDQHQDSHEVHVHPLTLNRLKILSSRIRLHFGNYSKVLRTRKNDQVAPGVLRIPRRLTRTITIPDLPYDYYLKRNHLHVGPVIGFFVLSSYYDDPQKQLLRFSDYNRTRGLIFLLKPNQRLGQDKTVRGKYYDPIRKTFVNGIFPLPSSIFSRVSLKRETYQRYRRRIGNKLFNYPYKNTNKWLFWSRFSKDPLIRKHLPATTRYTGIPSLLRMLNKYKFIYLKPTTMAGGKGIVAIRSISNNRKVWINGNGETWNIESKPQLLSLIKKYGISSKPYIVQQGIPSDFQIGKVDFRIYIQKDGAGRWNFSGLETKIGKRGSIISNSKNRSKIVPGKVTLRELYGLTDVQIKQKIKQVTQLGATILEKMERQGGLLGDAAIDFVIDHSLNIHILEVQLNYAAEIKQDRTEDEREVLPSILHTPFQYAKHLAGFYS
ncbi:YheC/YheD family protein [Brevibacillus humidisoli]|uniref:YheC/YheD family protein n=1 Tax=Brevibacillus humidisoli TaxID=2895522 RepID=UPI001E50631D|nr:YheC/YheD family protein [Brevibacillus humidisoli]UFJ39018.1 YheC/YheD family protein [Brevibacillus humidisoli]